MYTDNFLCDDEEEVKVKIGKLKEDDVSCQTLHRYMKRYGVDCEVAADMLSRMLEVEPKKRWTAQALIAHGLFTGRDATRVEKEKAKKQMSEQMAKLYEKVDEVAEKVEEKKKEREKEEGASEEERGEAVDRVERMISTLITKNKMKMRTALNTIAMEATTTTSILENMEERMKELMKRGEEEISKMNKDDIMTYLK